MKISLRYVLLFIPVLWFLSLWLTIVFHVDLHIDGLFYEPSPYSGYPPPIGLFPIVFLPILTFIGTPIMFFIGSIYTAYKKLWWWFAAYMILAGFPLSLLFFH